MPSQPVLVRRVALGQRQAMCKPQKTLPASVKVTEEERIECDRVFEQAYHLLIGEIPLHNRQYMRKPGWWARRKIQRGLALLTRVLELRPDHGSAMWFVLLSAACRRRFPAYQTLRRHERGDCGLNEPVISRGMLPPGIVGIDLHEYVCGGYFLARLLEAGKERPHSAVLPKRYISASHCLCDFFTDSWAWDNAGPMDSEGNFVQGISDYEGRLERAAAWGITAEELPRVIRWGQLRRGQDFGIPRGFRRLIDARRTTDWIHLPPEAYVIFGIGLHRSLTTELLGCIEAHYSVCTVPTCVREALPLSPGGAVLGHELLSTESGGPAHSWICGGMEDTFARRSQVTVNEYGYIERLETALACTKAINSGVVPAEPGRWFTWLIVQYA